MKRKNASFDSTPWLVGGLSVAVGVGVYFFFRRAASGAARQQTATIPPVTGVRLDDPSVGRMQALLNSGHYLDPSGSPLSVDSKWGADTQAAVVQALRDSGWSAPEIAAGVASITPTVVAGLARQICAHAASTHVDPTLCAGV